VISPRDGRAIRGSTTAGVTPRETRIREYDAGCVRLIEAAAAARTMPFAAERKMGRSDRTAAV